MKPTALPLFSAETIVRGGALAVAFAAAILVFSVAPHVALGADGAKPDQPAVSGPAAPESKAAPASPAKPSEEPKSAPAAEPKAAPAAKSDQAPAAAPTEKQAAPDGGTLSDVRKGGEEVLKTGRKLENVGRFQDAYDRYSLSWRDKALRGTGQAADIQLADQIKARYKALHYMVPQPQLRTGVSVFWKPKSDADLEAGRKELYATYPAYRDLGLALAKLGMEAAKFGQSTDDQAAYDAKVGQVMDAYVNLVAKSNQYQLTTVTFTQLQEGVRYMTGANREWANAMQRKNSLKGTFMYFEAAEERFKQTTQDQGSDNIWPR